MPKTIKDFINAQGWHYDRSKLELLELLGGPFALGAMAAAGLIQTQYVTIVIPADLT